MNRTTDLCTPIPMTSRHANRHLPQVRNLLSLEAVEVCLDCRAGVLQVLRCQMQGILQLHVQGELRGLFDVRATLYTPAKSSPVSW